MIISTEHRYLFVELPLTGSTAVARELVDLYAGRQILKKHSTYQEFLRSEHNDGGKYFVFAGIRNPLDQAVSHYFKLKLDHKGQYSRGTQGPRTGGLHVRLFRKLRARQFEEVHARGAGFEQFLTRFYPRPYSNWSLLSHKQFDAVLRFETLSRDFSSVLRQIGIEEQRALPVHNKTDGRRAWTDYYDTDALRRHAQWVFAPFMAYWGYSFPPSWGAVAVSGWQQLYYDLLNSVRMLYWKTVRYRV